MKYLLTNSIIALFFCACSTTTNIPKKKAYEGFYNEMPTSILLMPPINKSTNVDAKEYFYSTLNIPLVNQGYYVIPPFLSMEILKQESAYDSELFLDAPLLKFREVFGADLVVFTIIHGWDKSGISAKVNVEVEYIIKTAVTGEIIYSRKGDVTYDTSVSTGLGGLGGLIADMATSAINTAFKRYVDVARACNAYTLSDLPVGIYHPKHGTDGEELAGKKNFKVSINSNSGY